MIPHSLAAIARTKSRCNRIFAHKSGKSMKLFIPCAAGVRTPLVVLPILIVEVEGPLMANVEKSNLEEKTLCVVLYMIYQMG